LTITTSTCPWTQLRSREHANHRLCARPRRTGRHPVTIEIPEAGARTTVTTDADGNAAFSVKAAKLVLLVARFAQTLQSPPHRGEDQLADDIGFRDIRVDGTRIRSMARQSFLRRQHAARRPSAAAELTRRRMRIASSATSGRCHATFVRLAHYPMTSAWSAPPIANGILVWSEIPRRASRLTSRGLCQPNDAQEMIRRDPIRLRDSMVRLERTGTSARTSFSATWPPKPANSTCTRLITSALNTIRVNGNERVQTILCDVLDVSARTNTSDGTSRLRKSDNIHWTFPAKPC